MSSSAAIRDFLLRALHLNVDRQMVPLGPRKIIRPILDSVFMSRGSDSKFCRRYLDRTLVEGRDFQGGSKHRGLTLSQGSRGTEWVLLIHAGCGVGFKGGLPLHLAPDDVPQSNFTLL